MLVSSQIKCTVSQRWLSFGQGEEHAERTTRHNFLEDWLVVSSVGAPETSLDHARFYGWMLYIYNIYILSSSAAVSEAFASDFVFNLVWDSRRLRFPAFVLALSTAFLKGRARGAPTGVLPCAHLGVSRHRRARRPRTRRIFAEERRHGGSIFFGPGYLFSCCSSAKSFLRQASS